MANVVDVQRVAHAQDEDADDYVAGHLPSLVSAASRLAPKIPRALVKNRTMQRSFRYYKRRQRGFSWLSDEAKLYSAADAWATLELFKSLRKKDPKRLQAFTEAEVLAKDRRWKKRLPNPNAKGGPKERHRRGSGHKKHQQWVVASEIKNAY